MSSGDFVRALPEGDLPDGAKRAVQIEGEQILLCRSAGRLYAISNLCSHAEAALEDGRMGHGWIACPVHGARFALATGCVMNPPATRPIRIYDVRIQDGWIEVAT